MQKLIAHKVEPLEAANEKAPSVFKRERERERERERVKATTF